MHHSDMQLIIKTRSLVVISYDEMKGKRQTNHVMLTVTPTLTEIVANFISLLTQWHQ